MKNKIENEKAITLIALIITIVVLLILAVVAINAVTGDGIIQHAVNAKTEYEKAQDEENETLSYYESYLNVKGQVGKWIQTGETVERTNASGVKEKLPAIKKVNKDGSVQTLAIGDYVGYEVGVEGYTDEKGWQVLGVDNGKILLVSANSVGTCELVGKDAIENCKNRLDAVCLPYLNEELASMVRSINAEDINKITGHNPEENKAFEGEISEYSKEIKYTKVGENILYESIDGKFSGQTGYSTFEYWDGKEWGVLDEEGESVILRNTAYSYYLTDMDIDVGSILYNMLTLSEASYWFASTSFAMVKSADYYVSYMGKKGGTGCMWRFCCDGYVNTENASTNVRAVITLKEDKSLKWNEQAQVWDIE